MVMVLVWIGMAALLAIPAILLINILKFSIAKAKFNRLGR